MKTLIICFIIFTAQAWAKLQEEKYTDQYDKIDVDQILNSDRLFNNYFNCLKTGKKCTADAQTMRDLLPDALQTKCSKCTEVQKQQSKKVMNFLIKNKYKQFRELEDLFDPQHKYRNDYAEDIKKEGIVLPPL